MAIDTALITGAASGIGLALARRLHQDGVGLVLVDRDATKLRPVASSLDALAVPIDVSSPDDHESLLEIADVPTLLCLNAGVTSTRPGPVWDAPPEEWRRVFDVNLGGVVNGLRTFVPAMLSTGRPHHVLITASLAGLATWPGGGPYGASKHAVVAVAEQAALSLRDTPITVTLLCPSLVRTGMSDVGDEPADVAAAALAAVHGGKFAVVSDEWTDVVKIRANRLVNGEQPLLPQAEDREHRPVR